ncbi:MAG: hypothetical protein OXD48_11970 [Litoreibacter sp.]|nr:hypothetical protein [Litoreibacter sp.]
MRKFVAICALAALAACEVPPTKPEVPEGPAFEITQATRAGDTTTVVMRYKDGSAIPREDEARAALKATTIACREEEDAIADTRKRSKGLLSVNVFCVQLFQTDEVVDGSGLKT